MTISTNLFSGTSGNSDGTTAGTSREITLVDPGFADPYVLPASHEVLNIHVVGVWDTAVVSMEKYLDGEWYPVDVEWIGNRILEGLLLEVGVSARLNILNVGATTNLKVFVGHGYALT